MNDVTQINNELSGTVINSELFRSPATVINTETVDSRDLPSGTTLLEKYIIIEKISSMTGEAALYLCEYDGRHFAAKIYHRENAIKPEVVAALGKIHSPYVAALYDFGEYHGRPVEIMQYFPNGSIHKHQYTLEELKAIIIPCINEGLKALHEAGIIHKDLKPSNIMLNDDGKSVAIIDFGISSFEKNGSTVIMTRTGMTPEYSAPETYRGLFLEESDYYSFGITLYELFCGKTPYQGLNEEQIAQYTSIQRIPFYGNVPQELKDLINSLTYYDITNRKDKKNPNRRWTYTEVRSWCDGKKQAIPGEGTLDGGAKIPAYEFMGRQYTNLSELVRALTSFWKEGKKQLFRGLLSGYFKTFDAEAAGHCMEAEEAAVKNLANDDIIYFRLLYQLCPDMVSFHWNGKIYESIPALGRNILDDLRNRQHYEYYISILANQVLSEYLNCIGSKKQTQLSAVKALENSYRINQKDRRYTQICLYQMGYLLSGQKKLKLNEKEFGTLPELVSYMTLLLNDSYDSFEEICNRLIGSDNELDPQFESWLNAIGKREELAEWKAKFSNS